MDLTRPLSKEQKILVGVEFERQCALVQNSACICCRRVRLNLEITGLGICSDCTKHDTPDHYEKNKWLPIWYCGGEPQYRVPDVLQCLTLAEKMLIQLASPFVPLRHIKNGSFGLSGHVCCFEQDVPGFVNTLPRSKNDVSMLEVLKTVQTEIGSTEDRIQTYKVRKKNVGNALVWLKEYNVEYKNIVIDMSALDWLLDGEGSLECMEIVCDDGMRTEEDTTTDINSDLGPSAELTRRGIQAGSNVKAFGSVNDAPTDVVSPDDIAINNEMVELIDASPFKADIKVQWPSCGAVAISEFSSTRIFARAFPWLFPGGLGDVKDFPGDIKKWGEYLLFYEDGRFTKDKFFCFFAMNYITRNRNASSGNWFIKDFNRDGPGNLEELKESIKAGNLQFVNRLTYFNKRVKGSTPFWFQKRAEVYSWINHHVENKRGPPSFFITLSCSEYYWVDLIRILRERMRLAGDAFQECYYGSTKLSQILNDYAIVVQEFFQIRVKLWFETVGKAIFGIAHWWGRFEFTPGRGQIHIHFLATREDQNILRLCYQDLKDKVEGIAKRNDRLASWAKEQFGLTATVDDGFDERIIAAKDSPCATLLSDVKDNVVLINEDVQNLMKYCQVHECNGFCLRKRCAKK